MAAPKKPPIIPPKPQDSTLDFFGLGYDGGQYHFNGRIEVLPPQQTIPGFQRISMLKYLPDHDGHYGAGHTQIWAFEGVVLPGSQLMLGRWWSPTREVLPDGGSYCGPFVFWAVEGEEGEGEGEGEAASAFQSETVQMALDFLDDIAGATL